MTVWTKAHDGLLTRWQQRRARVARASRGATVVCLPLAIVLAAAGGRHASLAWFALGGIASDVLNDASRCVGRRLGVRALARLDETSSRSAGPAAAGRFERSAD